MEQDYNVVPLFETVVELPTNIDTTVDSNVLAVNQAFDQSTVYITSIIEGNWDQVLSVNGQTGDVWVNPSVNDYEPGAYYAPHDMISMNGRLYRAKAKISSAPKEFDESQWEEVDVVDNILSDFKPNYAYEKGELAAVNGRLYRAKENFTSGDTFNEEDWEWVAGVVAKPFEPNQYYYKNTFIRVGQSIFAADKDFQAGDEYDPDDWTIIATAIAGDEIYDNEKSGLEATNVQDAIDEVYKDLKGFESIIGEDLRNKVESLGDRIQSLGDELESLDNRKVDKEDGKGLSANDFTDELKQKLEDIESGAEVNVQADWEESDSTADSFIKNKPAPYELPQATDTVLGGVRVGKRTVEQKPVVIDESTGELFTDENAENGLSSLAFENGHLIATLRDGTKVDSGALPSGKVMRQFVADMDGSTQTFQIVPAVNCEDVSYISINGVDYSSEYYVISEAGNSITTLFEDGMIPTGRLEIVYSSLVSGGATGDIERFKNGVPGLFVGSTIDGDIEETGRGDGTGKVAGWATVKGDIEDLKDNKQDEIPEGHENEYYRGDKTWATLNKEAVGLGDVENKDIDAIREELTGDVTPVEQNFVTGATLYEQLTQESVKNIQPDWDESDQSSYAYIKNKPNVVRLIVSTEDIGEGAELAANTLYAVYTPEDVEEPTESSQGLESAT